MNLKFFPYRLEDCLNDYKKELLFLGVEYYSRNLIFEHINRKTEKILGIDIKNVELSFYGEKLGGVWLYTNENNLQELVTVFENYFKTIPHKITRKELFSSASNIQYYWANNIYLVGLGLNPYTDKAYIYVCLKHNSIYTIED